MFITSKITALPSPDAQKALVLEERLKRLALDPELFNKFLVPDKYRERLLAEWDKELRFNTGKKLFVIMPCCESRLGGVWLEVQVEHDQAQLYLAVGDPEEGKKDYLDELSGAANNKEEPEFVRVSARDMEKELSAETREWLEKAWKEIKPVTAIKAEKITQPNSKCSCGSGKKFKKCCGRLA